ncbi:MAG: YidC/Oxa1 family insertase periplasmic-domain containing protein [Planctomycetota bacterium]|nr:YidC/Oxa1 family insertase periplasmic-domain containing protein [Planctomycetota bacterium]
MDRRTIYLMIAASWIFIVFWMFNPPKPQQDPNTPNPNGLEKTEPKQEAAETAESGKGQNNDSVNPNPKNKTPDSNQENLASSSKDQESENQKGETRANPSPSDNGTNTTTQPNQDRPENPPGNPVPKRRVLAQKFISLGSLAADSPYRFLVTFNNQAASIHRLELAQRHRNTEKLKYKDLEIQYGYLGHLDLANLETGGCRIQNIGSKTPADIAGLKVGDTITKFDGKPIESESDFQNRLKTTKPDQEVTVGFERNGGEQTVSVTLMQQPLEVIRPNIVPEQASFAFERISTRASFSTSLFHPVANRDWEALGQAGTEVWESETGEDWVKFYYPFKNEKEVKDSQSEFQIIKTFRLIPVAEKDRDVVPAMNYHLDFDIEVKNLSDQPKTYAYRINGPNGLPTEDWWFAIKIHGEWSAMFTAAGARDVVASTTAKSFHFVGGPKIYTNATNSKQKKPVYIIKPGEESPTAHELKYIGLDSHYFASALIPTDGEKIVQRDSYSAYAEPQGIPFSDEGMSVVNQKRKTEAGWYRKLVPVNFKAYFRMENPTPGETTDKYLVAPGESVKHSYLIFAGPKENELLEMYTIADTVTYGWFAAFSWPLVKLLHLFYAIIGNYAIAIVILTILVRLAMMRFSRKMVLNAQMMQLLSPEIKALTEKHKDDFQAKSRAQQELFRKYNYNPFSGCLVMLIQLPVFIGLYRGLSVDMALRDQPLIPGINWCSNLAGPDQFWRWADSLPPFMSFLTHETGWLGPYFNVLPIISVVLMLIQQKLFTPPPTDEQQAMMQKVMTFMMVFIGVIFFKVPSGLCIYFITSTLWAIMEKKLIPPPQLPEHLQKRLDEIKALQAKEKEDGVAPGTYTNVATPSGRNGPRKHTERAKKKSQKNRRK